MLGAKLFFLVVGFVQQPLLRLAVGLADFGGLAQARAVANIVNNIIIQTGTQGVSRVVAGAKGREDEAFRASLRVHVPLAVAVAAVMVVAAPLYARFERAQDVIAPLLVLAGVALLYGIYAPAIGYLNGRRRFGQQALLDVTFATLRTVGLVGVGYAFVHAGRSGVLGTTVGWVVAAALIVPLAAAATGTGAAPRDDKLPAPRGRAYLTMLLRAHRGRAALHEPPDADRHPALSTGRFFSRRRGRRRRAHRGRAAARGRGAGSPSTPSARRLRSCHRTSCSSASTLVLFPMVARAQAEGDHAAVRTYVARGARLAAIFGGLLVGIVVALPESLLYFAYGKDAAGGADVLRTMALAQGAFAMLGIATTVLTSIGRERVGALVTLGAVLAVGAACAILVPSAPFGHDQLTRVRGRGRSSRSS